MGIRGPAAVDRDNYLAGTNDAGRFALGATFPAGGGRGFARVADWLDRTRTGRPAIWHRTRLRLRSRCADLPGTRFAVDHERIRVAFLDGRGSGCPEDSRWRKPKALAFVWRDLRRWIAEQAFHVDLWLWSFRWLAAHFAKEAVLEAVDLAGRLDRARDFSAELVLGNPSSLSYSGTAAKCATERPKHGNGTGDVPVGAGLHSASVGRARVDCWSV